MNIFAHVFLGTAFTSQSPNKVQILKDHLFCINQDGLIERVISPGESGYEEILETHPVHRLTPGQYILPGFIDLHVHAPQWAQAGVALDVPLYDWLHTYTFPLEAKFSDVDFASKVYNGLIDTLLANGTTTARQKDSAVSSARLSWMIRIRILRTTGIPAPLRRLLTLNCSFSPSSNSLYL